MDRTREESITVDTLSLEQLGNLLAKFGDSVNGKELPSKNTFERSLVLSSKDYHHQPEKNVQKLAENESYGRTISQVERRENGSKEESPMPQCQVEISRLDSYLCVPLRKKALDRILLLLLISAISIGIILPFCLTVGTTIYERSSAAGIDFTYDEACDTVSS